MKYFLVVALLFFSACSVKNYEHTTTKIVTIKTKKFRFSDIGYIRNTDDALQLELFMAGTVVKRIEINHLICVSDEGCISKKSFNEAYLSSAYPENILQNILLGRKIFNGSNFEKSSFGFTQRILTQEVEISYRVTPKEIYFKDRKNHILFKIKDVQ
ncbi:hypothetical protein [Sulfurimonas paralvinellae]|uniref:Lipoprotein n=1 Tax=Sulfurimonas paralvinellae TaxID=317658 RepID=A0A7M1B9K0_9BACT|nr:hypothetical protein [Sulfurimonas paralvinellae]QOP46384.1 hypothetical protein FM071_08800 [Sulfurimonas paralvinellae]